MQKTSSTSNYDVIVIRHRNDTLKSTPFQTVFSEKAMRMRDNKKNKLKQLQLYINDQLIDLPIRIDPSNGRVQFQKKYTKKPSPISDSSDMSDDDRSICSVSSQKRLSFNNSKRQSIEQLKNEQAPYHFWQFAWLFSSKRQTLENSSIRSEDNMNSMKLSNLAKIKEEPYEGQQSESQPLFQLSMCGHLLAKRRQKQANKQQLERIFYANRIQYKDFLKDPLGIIEDTNLVVRIDNCIYTWQLGAAIIACKYAFGVQPRAQFIDDIIKAKSKKSWFPLFSRDNVTKLDIEKQPPSIQIAYKAQDHEIIRNRKTPDAEMLIKMKLKYGQNKAKFSLEITPGVFQETQFRIYLWGENQKIIISDIDGTITKSDVMGQLKTNYIHKGVCLLYNQIYKRNYKILYMTARAIGQYNQTRKFLVSQVVQNGLKLPPGPILMSPDGYLKSFSRQVLQKNPDQLKIKLLASINQIFPNTKRPIIAGFGNRQTDSIAYLRIKIPADKIFCISQKSVITIQQNKDFSTNYIQMLEKIDQYFPLYAKPEDEQLSNIQLSSSKENNPYTNLTNDDNEDDGLLFKRKMSLSDYHDYSPRSASNSDRKELFKNSHRAKSQEGDPNDSDFDFQGFMEEFMSTGVKGFKHESDKKKNE